MSRAELSSSYRALLRAPGIRLATIAGFVGQFSQAAGPLGLLLITEQVTGSLAAAGGASAAFGLGAGLGRPLQGALIDRGRPTPVLLASAAIHCGALLGAAALATTDAPAWLLLAISGVAGAGLPAMSVSMRLSFVRVVPAERVAAFALITVAQELSILLGPALLGVLVAVGSPQLALSAIAAITGAGTVVFACCRVVRGFVSEGVPRGADRAHPLADPRLRRILLATLLIGTGFGAVEVAIPAFAIQRGSEAASGLLIAALSLGGIAGGLVLGSVPGGSTVQRRAGALIAGLSAGFCLLALAPSLAILAVLLVVAGLPLTAAITMVTLLVDDNAPPGSAAQAIGWLATSIATGAAVGAALAGPISEQAGTDPAFLLGAAAVACAAALTIRVSMPAAAGRT